MQQCTFYSYLRLYPFRRHYLFTLNNSFIFGYIPIMDLDYSSWTRPNKAHTTLIKCTNKLQTLTGTFFLLWIMLSFLPHSSLTAAPFKMIMFTYNHSFHSDSKLKGKPLTNVLYSMLHMNGDDISSLLLGTSAHWWKWNPKTVSQIQLFSLFKPLNMMPLAQQTKQHPGF